VTATPQLGVPVAPAAGLGAVRSRERGSGRSWRVISTYLLPVLILSVIVGIWQYMTIDEKVSRLILPPPMDVVRSFWELFQPGGLGWSHLFTTFFEAIVGFALATVTAVFIATFAALSVNFKRAIYPFVVALQVTPRIAVSPIIIAALGFGMLPKVVIAALVCFFPILINLLTGLLSVGPNIEEMFRSLRAPKRSFFRYAMVPCALPYAMPGFLTGISFALIGAIVAEFISGSSGLGYLIKNFSFLLNMGASYAVVVSLTMMGLVLFALMNLAKPYIVFWESDRRLSAKSKRMRRQGEREAAI
jgi:NitT/TauT family transport system permease protein